MYRKDLTFFRFFGKINTIILGFCLIVSILTPGCSSSANAVSQPVTPASTAHSEMRGVWISRFELDEWFTDATVPQARQRIDAALDTCAVMHLNTVFYHARAYADAYYASKQFPAAKAVAHLLEQGFDPLSYAIEAAHRHKIELHAWLNPYRIGQLTAATPLKDMANAVFACKGDYYYSPSNAKARALVLDGVRELLAGYDIDGIHFDDYFYPTALPKAAQPFEAVPEEISVADWRRTQVDLLVSGVHSLAAQYGVAFGISPAGNPDTCHNAMYADVARWLATAGYVDYLCPQIYYGFLHQTHPFDAALEAWTRLPRAEGVRLIGGLALYKAWQGDDLYAGTGRTEWQTDPTVTARQVVSLRQNEQTDGFVLFRYAHLSEKDDYTAAVIAALRDSIE